MRSALAVVAAAVLVACGSTSGDVDRSAASPTTSAPPTTSSETSVSTTTTTTTTEPVTSPRPPWLGTRVLPLRPDGLGEILPTPPELADRRFATVDDLPVPESDTFAASIEVPSDAVIARSTWSAACPVERGDLRYVTLPFWGFDQTLHTGELLVHADAVDAMVDGFRRLFDRRFPIEEMRITRADELDLEPTGDGNNTSAFVCRPTVGSTSWSQHAYGRAVDVNPFHNPYVRGDVVIPELASSYADRPDLPGVLGDEDVGGFVSDGWGWGGRWQSSKDYMHVSANGR